MKKNTVLIAMILSISMITISIIYNTFPRLQLNGKTNITLSYRDDYEEAGVIVKNANNSYLSKVKIDSNINDDVIGNYYIDYSLKIGIRQLHVRRNVKIIDNIAPIIKLNGDQIINMSINEEYKEPGYKAIDEYDGDLTNKVVVTSDIDTSNYGEHIIKYKVTDNSNNTVEVNRIVKIIDEIAPKFECKSDYSAFTIGSKNIVGCKAIDNFDGDITDKIQVTGTYDINNKGLYKVNYHVEDDAGNSADITHNIIIYEEKDNPTAYLTFNAGPSNTTKHIIKILKEKKINASFFVSKQEKNDNYKYLKEIIENENELGINGYIDKENINIDTFKTYYEEMQKVIYENTREYPHVYRFEEGSKTKKINDNNFTLIKEYLNNNKIIYYDWNIDSKDYPSSTIKKEEIELNIINELLNNKENQAIIQFHDTEMNQATVEALPNIIEILKEMHYSFDKVSNAEIIQFRK